MGIFYFCCLITGVVFGVMLHALVRYRLQSGSQVTHFHKKFSVELVWALIPFLIVLALTAPIVPLLHTSAAVDSISTNKE